MMKGGGQEPAGILLARIYEDLASEDEVTRMSAAYSLLMHIQAHEDQTKTILTRLFRGLCSGRKAARLGFATALTEMLFLSVKEELGSTPSTADIITILEEQTKPESNTTGQDERDHYFGRLFGIEAIIKSEILLTKHDSVQWDRLLDLICALSLQKPWLRQACGWVLYQCVKASLSTQQRFAIQILEKLTHNKLIRTPEGLAIWLEIKDLHPKAQLPKHVWKNNDPLSMKDLQTLAEVLKDAKVSSKNDDDTEVQGSAMWAANLHFVWDIVLAKIFTEADKNDTKQKELVGQFWRVAVDEALFAVSNSKERKHWGFLVMQRTLEIAPANLVDVVFSKNAVDCLMQSLKADDSYLQRSAQLVVQILQGCAEKSPSQTDVYIRGLLRATDIADFDQITRTRTVENLLGACSTESLLHLTVDLNNTLGEVITSDKTNSMQRLRLILNFETKLIVQQVNQSMKTSVPLNQDAVHTILRTWINLTTIKSTLEESAKKLVLEKTQLAMEHILKLGRQGILLVMDLIAQIRLIDPSSTVEAEPEILDFISAGWQRFEVLHSQTTEDNKGNVEGQALLYGLILFEIHSGDIEAIQILRELLDLETDTTMSKKAAKKAAPVNADALVEILLSFASRPSKFLRRVTLMIFETLTSQMTQDGLQSLTDILETKETKAGQQELFEANGDHDMGEDSEDEDSKGSDVEMLDSDVEVVDASDSSATSSNSSDSSSEGLQIDDEEDTTMQDADENSDAALLALETSLASALGTRKLTQADIAASSTSSDTDSDMTDSEMLAIDEKLAEVFRNRANVSNPKRDQKSAKENITNFKNRILDMIEVYVRKEHLNSHSLDLILPLLTLSRSTSTKQLADRSNKILLNLCKRCSGLDRVPTIPVPTTKPKFKSKSPPPPTQGPTPLTLTIASTHTLLTQIHTSALTPNTSNAYKQACSKTSILVVKTLLKAGAPIDDMEAVYAETTQKMHDNSSSGKGGEMSKAQREFVEDWKNFRTSVRGKLGK